MARTGITPPDMAAFQDEWRMSPGVRSNGLLFLTGMTGSGPDGISDDAETQIRAAFSKVDSVLQEAGLDSSHIVEMTSYHVGLAEHLAVFRRVREEFVVEPYPAWTAIEVAGFVRPGVIVEIRVVADASSAQVTDG